MVMSFVSAACRITFKLTVTALMIRVDGILQLPPSAFSL
jgi:hypothetical protein